MREEIKALLESDEPEAAIIATMLALHGRDRNFLLRQVSIFETALERVATEPAVNALRRGLLAIERRLVALDEEAGRVAP